MTNQIHLTDKAIEMIRKFSTQENFPPIIRAGVKGGGCVGFTYSLFFEEEEKITDTDQVTNFDEIKIVIDMMSSTFLENVTIDYVEGLTGAGFKFINSSIKTTCGCGLSFKP